MKTKHFLVLSLLLSMAISVLQAQVRIGALSAPRSGIGLDLNRDNNTSATALGLPVVSLVNIASAQPLATDFSTLQGAIVYNTTVGGVSGFDEAGIYLAGTGSWVRLLMSGDATDYADIVLLSALPSTVWLGADGASSRILNIITSIDNVPNVTLSYQWYYVVGEGTPVAISSATTKSFTVSAGVEDYKLQSAGQIKRYFCVVHNGTKSSVTPRVRAVYGSGVFLNNDQWLNVLGYNLGATGTTLTPTQQYEQCGNAGNGGAGAATVSGDLYQWGRDADGHEKRDLANDKIYSGVVNETVGVTVDANGQVPNSASDIYGKFITRNDTRENNPIPAVTNDWRNFLFNNKWETNDPCKGISDGGKSWRLPTSAEWTQIYNNNYPENTGVGLRFRPDGSNTSVFLPAAGNRNRANGALAHVGTRGYYWSSSPSSTNASYLNFSATVSPAGSYDRSYGFSVRCVAE
jgi:hypothetical protein